MNSPIATALVAIIIALAVTGLFVWGAIAIAPHIPALALFILVGLLLVWAFYETVPEPQV
jgi:hypothetical protein